MKAFENSVLMLRVDGHTSVARCVDTRQLNDNMPVLFAPILHLDRWHGACHMVPICFDMPILLAQLVVDCTCTMRIAM
jgi:hypothetical protein